ncbi:MAG: GNAT family N-acetyltransferase [Prevotellaceae bacterium]|jgi:ribosomal-protein-serine acetyltransferase|nr:GNAT family N-acetyltransferase [Prevotellaceae bacterium]
MINIETEMIVDTNIRLEEIDLKHIDDIFNTIDKQREYLSEWLPFVPTIATRNDTEKFVNYQLCMKYIHLTYIVYFQNEFAGLIGLKDINSNDDKTEIGYWLSEHLQGRGIITKSCRTLIKYAFEQLYMNRIQIRVAVGNEKSVRVARRLNFIEEGIERAGERYGNIYFDLHVFSLLRNDIQPTD